MTLCTWISNLETKDIVSIASAVIALCALFTAIWNAVATRKHHKLSVRPHLSLMGSIIPESPHVNISVRNTGLGTAILDKIEVYLDNAIFPITRATHWFDLVQKLHNVTGDVEGYAMFNTESLRPGESLTLLEITGNHVVDPEVVQAQIERIKIVVSYKSMYEERFTETYQRN